MRTPVDPRLRDEAERFRFRFSCCSCLHFDRKQERCANGYPNTEHRSPDLENRDWLVFCKAFEL